MTTMKRVTIALPDNIDKKILELRKEEKFVRCSYAEIVRRVLDIGFQAENNDRVLEARTFSKTT